MPVLSSEALALIAIMDRQYREIRALEAQHGILGRDGDFRPRIEHYQDAVRALTSGDAGAPGKHGRLAVERLAYDLSILRQIIGKPTVAGRGAGHLSPHSDLAATDAPGSARAVPREAKQRLSELYRTYTVLFAALFAEKADRDATARADEAAQLVEECQELRELLAKMGRGEASLPQLLAAVAQVEDDQLRVLVTAQLTAPPDAHKIAGMREKLGQAADALKKESKTVDEAALHYATGRLAVYEEAKDVVKSLATDGMNLAGKFVEDALSRAGAQQRGR
jgi:hypothetical protein